MVEEPLDFRCHLRVGVRDVHGDWIRMIPTAIAGIVMSYLLLETGNLFYNCLFHFVNNLFSVLSVYFVQQIFSQLPPELNQGTELLEVRRCLSRPLGFMCF